MKRIVTLCAALVMSLALVLPAASHASSTSGGAWEFVSGEDGVRVYRKQIKGSNVFAFKGTTIAKVNIGRIIKTYQTTALRKDWVDRFHSSRDLQKLGELERIFWIRFGLPFPVSDRDYVIRVKAHLDHAKRVFTARLKSERHPAKPEEGGCCERGLAFGTYYRFTALSDGTTKVMVEVHTDPKGWLPGWLVNVIQKKWPRKTLLGLIKRAQRPDISNYAGTENWHKPPPAPAPKPAPAPAPAPAPTTP